MTALKLKLEQRDKDQFFGFETTTLLQLFPTLQVTVIDQEVQTFYQRTLTYLNKWSDFSDEYYLKLIALLVLKRKLSFKDICKAAQTLKVSSKLDMDQLHHEFSVTLPLVRKMAATRAPVSTK